MRTPGETAASVLPPALGVVLLTGRVAAISARELDRFLAEAAGPDWHHTGFELAQETPFDFSRAEDFSCAPNRGRADGPLFQLNHWIASYPPRFEGAERVNALDVLLARVEECRAARGQIPNIVAVDFHGTGDLIRVVDILNAVAPAQPR